MDETVYYSEKGMLSAKDMLTEKGRENAVHMREA